MMSPRGHRGDDPRRGAGARRRRFVSRRFASLCDGRGGARAARLKRGPAFPTGQNGKRRARRVQSPPLVDGVAEVADESRPEVQTALFDLHRYLLDQIPPITAAEAVETLMEQPPQLLVRQVNSWMLEQGRMQSLPASDFVFHALKKVHLTAELKLLDRAAVGAYLDKVIPLAMQLCPAEDRELLRQSLEAMRDSRSLGGGGTKIEV